MRALELAIWVGILVLIMTGFSGCAPLRDSWGGNNPTWTKKDLARVALP